MEHKHTIRIHGSIGHQNGAFASPPDGPFDRVDLGTLRFDFTIEQTCHGDKAERLERRGDVERRSDA